MKIILYSAVKDKDLFSRVGFYRDDINALSMRGDKVVAVNSLLKILVGRPHLVIGYFFSNSLFAALLGRLMCARVILTGGADQISPVLSSGYKLLLRRLVALLCLILSHRILLSCSDDVLNFRSICFGINFLERKIELVKHVVIATPLGGRVPVDGEFDAFTICWMGAESNVRRKGVDKAIRMIAQLHQIGVNARLKVAGTDGPGKRYLEDLARDLNVSAYICFLGPISESEKNALFSKGSVYLQLSMHEGFGVAAAEAYFSGMNVVHSNKGGLKDVIGERGIVVEPSFIENSDLKWVRSFYAKFLQYRVNVKSLEKDIYKYSTKMRSDAFFNHHDV
jgi:glycosyltransferase involved in cell wall biosynthesis